MERYSFFRARNIKSFVGSLWRDKRKIWQGKKENVEAARQDFINRLAKNVAADAGMVD